MASLTGPESATRQRPFDRTLLASLLTYEPDTGIFRWAEKRNSYGAKAQVGGVAGYLKPGSLSSGGGYRNIGIDGRAHKAHRLAWLYMTGEWPEADVDHINGDRDDNRWSNLRAATRSQNLANSGIRKDNISGIKGVSFDASRGKYRAQICWLTKRRFLGRFDTAEEARVAYEIAAAELFGEFARVAA